MTFQLLTPHLLYLKIYASINMLHPGSRNCSIMILVEVSVSNLRVEASQKGLSCYTTIILSY